MQQKNWSGWGSITVKSLLLRAADQRCRIVQILPHGVRDWRQSTRKGGHVQVAAFSPGAGLPHVRAGKIRPLAFIGPKRHPDAPNVPTMIEEGYDDGLDGNWQGFLAPKGTPRPIIEKLAAGFKKMTENPRAIAGFQKLGEEFGYMGPDEFAKYWRKDFQIYKEMGKMFKKEK
jgi:tripartite-type tricarboxylate transporter receptor subunit TctC